MTAEVVQKLRSDARDNRERILEVARAAFAAEGLDVPIREIARRAQVGVATVYRASRPRRRCSRRLSPSRWPRASRSSRRAWRPPTRGRGSAW